MIQGQTPRKHSREFKFEVVRLVTSGEKSPSEVCREHNLANSVLDRWRKEYDRLGENAFQLRRQWQLSRPVDTPQKTETPAPTTVMFDHPRQDRVAQLERLCGILMLENFLLKQSLQRTDYSAGSPLSLLR